MKLKIESSKYKGFVISLRLINQSGHGFRSCHYELFVDGIATGCYYGQGDYGIGICYSIKQDSINYCPVNAEKTSHKKFLISQGWLPNKFWQRGAGKKRKFVLQAHPELVTPRGIEFTSQNKEGESTYLEEVGWKKAPSVNWRLLNLSKI